MKHLVGGFGFLIVVLIFFSGNFADADDNLLVRLAFEGNADDLSNYANHGAESGGVIYSAGKVGLAANFDGIDDHIDIPDSDRLDLTNDFTIDFWVNPSAAPGSYSNILRKESSSQNNGFGIEMIDSQHPNEYKAFWKDGSSTQCNKLIAFNLTPDEWQHIAVVKSNTVRTIYWNGVQVESCTGSNPLIKINSAPLQIGGWTVYADRYWKGSLDELEIYDRALTSGEIQSIYLAGGGEPLIDSDGDGVLDVFDICPDGNDNLDTNGNGVPDDCEAGAQDNLVARLAFDGNADDLSIYANHGSEFGGVTYSTGKVGLAANFDGIDDYIDIPDSESLDLTNDFTIDFWVKPSAAPGPYSNILRKESSSQNNGFGIEMIDSQHPNEYKAFWKDGSSTQCNKLIAFNLTPDEWQHIAVVKSNAIRTVYWNGVLVESCTGSNPLININSAPLQIGGWTVYAERYWKGSLDELEIYDRALTSEEIQSIYVADGGEPLADSDGDGVPDLFDTCPDGNDNLDTNGNGVPDECEACAQVNSGIISWWPGNGNADDVVGVNDGLPINGAKYSDGVAGQAFDLSEPDSYIEVSHDNSLTTQYISISAWIKPTRYNYAAPIVKKAGTGTNQPYGYALEFSGTPPYDRIKFWISDGNWHSSLDSAPVGLNTWTHVAGTFDGAFIKIYINGTYSNAFNIRTNLAPSTNPLMIGKDPSNLYRSFSGYIDEVIVYNRALTAQEIKDIFNAGSQGICIDQSDTDGDGIPNASDNCLNISNPDQSDWDVDGIGDACDPDDDNDGVLDPSDNCQFVANAEQADSDSDMLGDPCDDDDDNDGVSDTSDNCRFLPNADQSDVDADGLGDLCDADPDGDGILANDNCPYAPNPDQVNTDGDSEGDACDADDDNDGVLDDLDNCQITSNNDQKDLDSDYIGDACDADIDGDGVPNESDNCIYIENVGQQDSDLDNTGDACDPDDDNDLILDADDNCQFMANQDQADEDEDGKGDVCDNDLDGDGIGNSEDNCPVIANGNQADWDLDDQGDACDLDIDGDGVINDSDECQFSELGQVIDPSNGCSIVQLVPCEGPRGTIVDWKNHGQYVSTLSKTTKDFVTQGLITDGERDILMEQSANLDCGQ